MRTTLSVTDGPWVDNWLSKPRLLTYLSACGLDRRAALDLYEWNSRVSSAFHNELAHLEVAVRNAYDRAIRARWTGRDDWTASPNRLLPTIVRNRSGHKVDINRVNRQRLQDAWHEAGGPGCTPGKVVAELSFGFWRNLSSSANEKALWVSYLHNAFPPGTDRAQQVDKPLIELHRLRNRVAHHEPLIDLSLRYRADDLRRLAQLLNPQLADYLRSTTELDVLLAAKPETVPMAQRRR
jgi:hypothetical protein